MSLEEENTVLEETVESENEMKEWLVDYVGDRHRPEDGNVTVAMIVEQMAEDFPEFVMAVAEENWVRGYQQGISDTHQGIEMVAAEREAVAAKLNQEDSAIHIDPNADDQGDFFPANQEDSTTEDEQTS